jgi:hypothetical protein
MAVLVEEWRTQPLSRSHFFITDYNPVLQSLPHTEYRAVCRRPSSLKASLELTYFLPLRIL